MRKAIKILLTIIFCIGGLLLLTYFRLNGIHIFNLNISADAVNAFVDSAGTKIYAVWISFVVLIFWGFWLGRWIAKKTSQEN